MQEWIHVKNPEKIPAIRAGRNTPFESFEDGFNPNDINPEDQWSEDGPFMFLPITRLDPPSYNPVIEALNLLQTTGVNGISYPGIYDGGGWTIQYQLTSQSPEISIAIKLQQLQEDYEVAILGGYQFQAGQVTYVLSYSSDFYQDVATRLSMLDNSIRAGQATTSSQIAFSDSNGREVLVTAAQFRTQLSAYNVAREIIFRKYIKAKGQIVNALTNELRNQVTWGF